MSDDGIRNIMNFLIQRQEVFAENLERIEGVVVRLGERMGDLTERVDGLAQSVGELTERVDSLAGTVGVLVESQKQLTDSHIQTQRDISFLAQALTRLAEGRA